SVPPSAFESMDALLKNESGEDAPRVAAQAIYAGQIIVNEALAPTGASGGLASVLPDGSRAMNLGIDTFTGLAGFLRPEARVDIVTTLRGNGEPTVVAIAQNIRVLAVNGRMHGEIVKQKSDEDQLSDERVPDSVTLQVTPEQAAAIDLAENQGTPRLVLRSGGDGELSKFAGMTLAELKGDPVARKGREEFDPYSGETYVGEWDTPVSTDDLDDAAPTTQPGLVDNAPLGATKRRPGPHVVEIIRGGISTKEVLTDRKQQKKGQAYAGDGSGDDAFAE
ncbi:MAG: Flp pilus assembly protein CpaB, partial [Planctomycetota bacterium]